MSFPGAIASFLGFTSSHTLSADQHAAQHNSEQAEIVAAQTKIGTGSSTATSGTVLRGIGLGVSSWAQVVLTTDVTGVLPQANGGTGTTLATGTGKAVYDTNPTITSPVLVTPTIADFTNATHNHQNNAGGGQLGTNALLDSAVTNAKVAAGTVVQVVSTNVSAYATGTTQIPLDDTIPQITEGTEFMTLSITPKSVTNELVVEVLAYHSSDGAVVDIIGALFQDTTANALAAISIVQAGTTYKELIQIRCKVTPATTSAITFRYRAGPASAVSLYFNGSGARLLGGVAGSNMTIKEYKV